VSTIPPPGLDVPKRYKRLEMRANIF